MAMALTLTVAYVIVGISFVAAIVLTVPVKATVWDLMRSALIWPVLLFVLIWTWERRP
jgi:hypothetical protein